jgi:colanic acid biosynthesis glycosyl transferase WcaI
LKVLYISQYFPPEIGAPAARVAELTRFWAAMGHQVQVLTGFPNHPTGRVPAEYRSRLWRLWCRESRDGISVQRTWLVPLPNRKSWERILNYTSFCISAAITGTFMRRPDVVIATSPQLLVGLAGWWVAAVKRVPFVFEVRDLWPESLAAVGVSGDKSLMMRVLRPVARFLYNRADHIVVVTKPFVDHIAEHWGVPREKLSIIRNGVDYVTFAPSGEREAVRERLGLSGKFVVGLIGTMGNAHGAPNLVEAANILRGRSDVHFLFVGEGAEKDRVAAAIKSHGLANATLLDEQPRDAVPGLISACDICAVLLRRAELFKKVVPTKMLEFMACERPVIAAVDGRAREIVEEAGAGMVVEQDSAEALANAVEQVASHPAALAAMGRNGRNYIIANWSREENAAEYLRLLEDCTSGRGAVPLAAVKPQ